MTRFNLRADVRRSGGNVRFEVVRPHRVYEWLRRHPYVVDAVITGLLGFLLLVLYANGDNHRIIALFLLGPLIWRRNYPATVFTIISLTCFVQLFIVHTPIPANVAFLIALYAVSAYSLRRWARFGSLAVGVLGAFLAVVSTYSTPVSGDGLRAFMMTFALIAASVAFTWTLGDLMRTRRAYVGELEERAIRLEVEREQETQIARNAERARIAREFHDVVAHSLAVVIAQADGGSYAGKENPQAAMRALETIGVTGRQALSEMRRLLGVLRTESDDNGQFAPQPDLSRIGELIARIRSGGLRVELDVRGEVRKLPPGLELAAYRIVQEALTNTLKHGGPAATAKVTITYAERRLQVRVVDDGRGAAAHSDGRGQGLHGMRERVALHGGELRAAPRAGGGFELFADLPYPDEAMEKPYAYEQKENG
jgi:signal transduction histidine kinase